VTRAHATGFESHAPWGIQIRVVCHPTAFFDEWTLNNEQYFTVELHTNPETRSSPEIITLQI
jgi:hypothetical protein